jgi:hypothetical protein
LGDEKWKLLGTKKVEQENLYAPLCDEGKIALVRGARDPRIRGNVTLETAN